MSLASTIAPPADRETSARESATAPCLYCGSSDYQPLYDGIQDRLLTLHLSKQAAQLLAGKTVTVGHFADKGRHVRRVLIIAGHRDRRAGQQAKRCQPAGVARSPAAQYVHRVVHHIIHSDQTCAIHLRWVWIDIKMPNPVISVTIEVPP